MLGTIICWAVAQLFSGEQICRVLNSVGNRSELCNNIMLDPTLGDKHDTRIKQ
jgi:hypothetical protein